MVQYYCCGNIQFNMKGGMHMKMTDILGEATEYDKKQAVERKKVKSWLKSGSAFANTAGGMLIFGITNDEEIVGLEDIKSDSEFISQKIKERISPFPEVVMKLHKTEVEKNSCCFKFQRELKRHITILVTG